MRTFFDYATNAACPQKPTWQISPVGYKWAQAVFQDCGQLHSCCVKKGVQIMPKLEKIYRNILFMFTQTVLISRCHTRKLFSAG